MKGHTLIPRFDSAKEEEKFAVDVRQSVGNIRRFQERSRLVVEGMLAQPDPLRALVPTDKLTLWDEFKVMSLQTQRWSDGRQFP